ncbi:RNA polymerase sigma factor [Pelosinus fermentans]|uniref:RNA polymerase sigma factor, sigma-70 family n=1 Tax=Pelosinus fermentans B4 TaxID=1149862 RepID=I9L8E0_9FIRM|nr:RNA polymerase sigma factor [Pelosinus fermentans]EIW16639.1 RNA polymerase sigma factor, sigma-70 family [Pelosinus fermentans B4]EIW22276.1 RNA polymerase, sigma-24 subunit, ECF subfamily [Pelosinus fermentans A11]
MAVIISDEELARQLQQGNETALETIVSRYHSKIFSYIYRMSKNYHSANDITQEVFIKICRNIKKYNPELLFKTWIYTIASNTCKDYLKSAYVQKTIHGFEMPDTIRDYEDTPEEFLQKQDEREAIIEVLNQLGGIHREVVVLRFYEDLKLEEIALVLNIPVGTVKSRLSNGLHNLKKLLKEGGEEIG